MRTSWLAPARISFLNYLAELQSQNLEAAQRAYRDIEEGALRLGTRPFLGQPSRSQGLREWSFPRWKKILVYRVDTTEISIVAFYDARQRLPRKPPT